MKKQCNVCKEALSIEEFGKDKKNKDGRSYRCKNCNNKRAKLYRENNADKLKEAKKNEYQRNKERRKVRAKEYYEENKERIIKRNSDYAKRNAQRTTSYKKRWSIKNKDRLKLMDAQKYLNNKERYKQYAAKRKALIRSVDVGDVDYDKIKTRDNMKCYLCGEKIKDDQKYHFDHVIPLIKGGPHSQNNIRITHDYCNQIKGQKDSDKAISHIEKLKEVNLL